MTEFQLDRFRVALHAPQDAAKCGHGFPRLNRKGQRECVFCGTILKEAPSETADNRS